MLSLDEPPSKAKVLLSQFLKWLPRVSVKRSSYQSLKWLCVAGAVVSLAGVGTHYRTNADSAFQQQVVILQEIWNKTYYAQSCLFALGALFFQKEQHRREDGK